MNLEPLISVIIPVYNREEFINESIDSILNQTYQNFELIIVDDCSTDHTSEIIRNYSKKENRIKILTNEKNLGATSAFNRGLSFSKGKYIARMDSDDISLPKRFEKQINLFNNWTQLDVLGTGAILIDEVGNVIGKKKFPSNYHKIKKIIEKGVPVFDPSVMIKSDILKKIGGFDNRMAPADDYHLWLILFKNKKIISNLDEYLIKYRKHKTNLSLTEIEKQLEKSFLAKKIYFSDYSTDQYLKYNKSLKKTYFEQLIIKYWKKEQTSIIGAKKIMREYFINYNFQDKSITNSILFVIYSLFLNKCYFLFFKYLLKFIIWKIIK